MNPRDEKLLLTIKKNQNTNYGNSVPFSIIQKSFPWIDGSELTADLLNLCDCGYLWSIDDPISHMGWWYGLTSAGSRECERIKYDNSEHRKNRNIQIISALIGVLFGFVLGKLFP